MEKLQRINVFGTQISIINLNKARELIYNLAKSTTGYICLPDSYVIVLANKNKKLRNILKNSLLTLPDGQPSVIYAKSQGVEEMSSVSGFWLVKYLLNTDLSHYFYGSDSEELKKIESRINTEYKKANVLGYKSPPWVDLEDIEINSQILSDLSEINMLKPNIVWIGLNSPKQDYLMAHYSELFDSTVLIGIGGVYSYLSGEMKISPEWVKRMSLRWVYRIIQNPRRIFKKTVIAILGFIWLFIQEKCKKK